MLRRLAAPTNPCLTLDDAKLHLRVDNDDEDLEIQLQLEAAIDAVEEHTGRALAPATYEFKADAWPWCWNGWPRVTDRYVDLPIAPVRSVTTLKYMDVDGAEQTVDAADWYWRSTDEGARLWLSTAYSSPTLWGRPGDVAIRFEAGYNSPNQADDDPALACPPRAKSAVLLLLGNWYANRESVIVGSSANMLPDGLQTTLNSLRIFR